MRIHRTMTLMLVFLVACVTLLAACKKTPPPAEQTPPPAAETTPASVPEATPATVPFSVTSIELGKAIDSDKKVTEPTTTFGTKDTIYASVSTDGEAPSATLKSKWTFGADGQLVKEEELPALTPTGPATHEFHISKASGWPVGKYKVEIFVDGTSAGTRDFEVK